MEVNTQQYLPVPTSTPATISKNAVEVFQYDFRPSIERIDKLRSSILEMEQEKEGIEKSWKMPLYKYSSWIANGGIMFGVFSVAGGAVGGIFVGAQLGVPLAFVGGVSIIGSCCIPFSPNYLENIEDSLSHAEIEKEILEFYLQLAEQIADFKLSWDAFVKDPREEKVKEIFDHFDKIYMLTILSPILNDARLRMQLFPKGVWGCNYLLLMDQICNALKDGQLISEWENLHNLPLSKIKAEDAQPWARLGIKNPDINSYIQYYEIRGQYQGVLFAHTVTEVFKQKVLMKERGGEDNVIVALEEQ